MAVFVIYIPKYANQPIQPTSIPSTTQHEHSSIVSSTVQLTSASSPPPSPLSLSTLNDPLLPPGFGGFKPYRVWEQREKD